MDIATNNHEYGYFSKEFEDFRFKYIKNYSIDKIKKEILKLDKEWFDDNSRQIAQPAVHKETNSFFLANLMQTGFQIQNIRQILDIQIILYGNLCNQ